MLTALFGINDGSLNLAVNLVILVLVVVWLSLVYWTWADARRRIGDPILVTTATVASLVPFIGTVVYTILRPPEYLEDVREREVETQASELRMRHLAAQSCPRCEHPIERTWLRCPECQHRLKDPCRSCNRPVDPRWSLCPYCETPLRRPSSASTDASSRSRARTDAPRAEGDGSSAKRRKSANNRSDERPTRAERQGSAAAADAAEDPTKAPPRRRRSTSSS
jgi:double zinc ribbon protein